MQVADVILVTLVTKVIQVTLVTLVTLVTQVDQVMQVTQVNLVTQVTIITQVTFRVPTLLSSSNVMTFSEFYAWAFAVLHDFRYTHVALTYGNF